MRIAVISDIHGNATALRQVLEDIDSCRADTVICLGDTIGYGPEPEAAINMLRQRNISSIKGNHELAVNNPGFLEWFNPAARLSLEKTMDTISTDNREYITGLPHYITAFGCRFVHGFPPDSPTTYMFEVSAEETERIMDEMSEPICFIGHTHELAIIVYEVPPKDQIASDALFREKRIETIIPDDKKTRFLDPKRKYIVNVGSVGQPRDGTSDAKYMIFDNEACTLEIRHVPYDINDTIKKIHAAGLPRQHALRLS